MGEMGGDPSWRCLLSSASRRGLYCRGRGRRRQVRREASPCTPASRRRGRRYAGGAPREEDSPMCGERETGAGGLPEPNAVLEWESTAPVSGALCALVTPAIKAKLRELAPGHVLEVRVNDMSARRHRGVVSPVRP